jgi:hypothetical protein
LARSIICTALPVVPLVQPGDDLVQIVANGVARAGIEVVADMPVARIWTRILGDVIVVNAGVVMNDSFGRRAVQGLLRP